MWGSGPGELRSLWPSRSLSTRDEMQSATISFASLVLKAWVNSPAAVAIERDDHFNCYHSPLNQFERSGKAA